MLRGVRNFFTRTPQPDGWGDRVCLAAGDVGTEPRYSLADPTVDPSPWPLTEDEYRDKLSKGIGAIVQELGPTKVGGRIGCNEKTVRNARDKATFLDAYLCWNFLLADPHALDPLAAHFNMRLVPLDDTGPTDWAAIGASAAELASEILRVNARPANGDIPRLKLKLRALLASAQGGMVGR